MKSIILALLLVVSHTYAQNSGCICGYITGEKKDSVPFVIVTAFNSAGSLAGAASADMNGFYKINYLQAGIYKLSFSCFGYAKQEIINIRLKEGGKVKVNIQMKEKALKLEEVVINGEGIRHCDLNISPCMINRCDMASGETGASSRKKSRRLRGGRSNKSPQIVTRGELYSRTKGEPNQHRIFGGNNNDFNTEDYKKIDENTFKEVKHDPLSTLSIDVDRASYSNIRRFISKGTLPPPDAVRVEEMINYFQYDYQQPKSEYPVAINTEFTECPWNKKHQLLHISIQGKTILREKAPVNNLVFLIDVSSSMNEPDKLPLVKSGLRLLVNELRDSDRVALVVYAGNAGLVLSPTSGAEKEKIMEAIDKLEAGGSTAGGAGIELAYTLAKENFMKDRNNRVLLATDGDFNVGVSSDGDLVRLIEKKREDGIFLTVLGFGSGNYKDSKMEQLADKGNGNYAYIDNVMEARKVLVKEMNGTLLTIAKDVKIQIEFNPVKVKGYRLVGYENRLLNKEDFNDDAKDAGEMGAGHTITAIYEIIPAGSEETLASVDELKYQKVSRKFLASDEIATVKCRYKLPDEKQSKLITEVIGNSKINFASTSENCRFACAVAEFGMLLRDSQHKQEVDFKSVLALAKESKGKDEEGYRSEFINLVEMAESLKK